MANLRRVAVGFALLACAVLPAAAADKGARRPAISGGAPRRAKRAAVPSPVVHAVAKSQDGGPTLADYSYAEVEPLGADSVEVEVHACVLNAGDVQQLRGDWGTCLLPLIPGREAVGVVTKVGKAVKGIAPGDRVGVILGTGMDSEDVENGSDRNRLDFATTGAAAHRIRVVSRWAFPLPLGIPTQHAAGALSSGGAIWQQLKKARLGKGSKVGIIGGGTAAGLAEQITAALGLETHKVVGDAAAAAQHTAAGDGDAELDRAEPEVLCAVDEDDLRLHAGSFDALLCVSACDALNLTPILRMLKRGGLVLLAAAHTPTVSLSPRLMHERALTLVGGGAPSKPDMLGFLAVLEAHGVKLAQTALELTADNAVAALQALSEKPEEQVLLQRSSLRTKWAKANKGKKGPARGAARGVSGADLGSAGGLVAGGVSSMFGALSRAAGEAKRASSAMREGLASSMDGLVKQVEKEVEEEEEAKFGSLKLEVRSPKKAAAGEEGGEVADLEEEEEEDGEGGEAEGEEEEEEGGEEEEEEEEEGDEDEDGGDDEGDDEDDDEDEDGEGDEEDDDK
eukprot:scaffold14880_cov91-Isochrysis_galbana.AAC.2